jgi:hypothetical protein
MTTRRPPEPLNVRALRAIEKRLRAIRVGNGYAQDLDPERVRIGVRSWDGDDAAISVHEGAETVDDQKGERFVVGLAVNCEFVVAASQCDTGIALGLGKADMKQALFGELELTDAYGHVGTLSYGGAEPAAREDGTTVEGVVVAAVVRYVEHMGNPYGKDE